jgi:3-hydroxyacyl-[acyl-carrier-protein] dehydratase
MGGARENSETGVIDVNQIMEMIPHRYPFLMIDKVVDIVKGQSAVGIKNVTVNEPFFQGHFPSRPVMPGVLLVEAMAQTAGIVAVDSMGEDAEGHLVYFMSIDSARFRKPVGPGDQVRIHVDKKQHRSNVWKFECKAEVGETVVANAIISAMILDE